MTTHAPHPRISDRQYSRLLAIMARRIAEPEYVYDRPGPSPEQIEHRREFAHTQERIFVTHSGSGED